VSLEPAAFLRQAIAISPLGRRLQPMLESRSACTGCPPLMPTPRRMTRALLLSLLAMVAGAIERLEAAQEIVTTMTPERIEEAVRLAADDQAAGRFLAAYVVQRRAGWGDGPLIGAFSTPFSRVVQAALTARKKGSTLVTADVKPELIAAELHMIATSQTPIDPEIKVAQVQSVGLSTRGSASPGGLVAPIRTIELTTDYQSLHGTTFQGTGVVAVFPLSALTAGAEIHVEFDQMVRGSTALSMCRTCAVPLNLSRIR
jgi:hypothetical protein